MITLPYIVGGADNIKLLQHYKSVVKQDIKIETNKQKVMSKRINELKIHIDILDKQIDKIVKRNKKRNKYFCNKCATIYTTPEYLNDHECRYIWNINRDNLSAYVWQIPVAERNNFNKELDKIEMDYRETIYIKKELNIRLAELIENIQVLSNRCHKCKESSKSIQNCGCDMKHLLCESCCEELDGKCPICSQDIDLQMCQICMNIGHSHIEVNCGNNHKICDECFQRIITSSSNPLCPFCRNEI